MSEVKLLCAQCGYSNEPERVYCHNCGAKLDRSLLPRAEEGPKKTESHDAARKRISKMANPRSTSFARECKTLLTVLAFAAASAVLILFALKPDGVPDGKRELASRMLSSELLDAVNVPRPAALTFTEAEANAHLKKVVKSREGLVPGIAFTRMYVNFLGEGVLRVCTEQSLWGYPVFSGMKFKLAVEGGKLKATCTGGNFGRMNVPPVAMQYADFAFQKLWVALQRDRDQMDKMQSVKVDKGSITLVTKGAAR